MSSNRTLYGTISATAPYGDTITQLNVKFTPSQSSTPSLMPETNTVYLSRPTEGTGELMELVGGSIAWNQLLNPSGISATATVNNVTFTNNGDGSVTVSGTASAITYFNIVGEKRWTAHKYLLRGCPSGGSLTAYSLMFRGQASPIIDIGNGVLWDASTYAYKAVQICVNPNFTISSPITFKPQVFDITQMFGSTIADYVYSLEQATAGSGIQWLKDYDLIDDQYHAYSQGSLESVNVSGHKMVGFNQWDEVWELGIYNTSTGQPQASSFSIRGKNRIHVFPNTAYYANNNLVRRLYYDAEDNFISFKGGIGVDITPANCHYMRIYLADTYGTTYNNDICINISNAEKNGTYEAYWSETYPIDSSVTLRGIPKKDADGNLYYEGDTYEWDGTVTRRYAEVDLGSLTWIKAGSGEAEYFYATISDIKPLTSWNKTMNVICPIYTPVSGNDFIYNTDDMTISGQVNYNIIRVRNLSYNNAAALKTAMNGVKLVYELATSTTESADPFTAVQTVEDGGTEEFVTTNGVPVGVVGRFANAVPMEGVDSFSVTANDGTSHTYPVTLSEEIYRGYVDMLTGEAVSDMASIAEYNGETINAPWLSSLDEYATGTTPTNGAQVVYPITPEEVTATITGDPTELGKVTSASSTEGTVEWSAMAPLDGKCIVRVVS